MRLVDTPNIPEGPVCLALVDGRINIEIETKLREFGIELIKTTPCADLHSSVAYHPDILFHHLGGPDIIHAPGVSEALLQDLSRRGFNLIKGETRLTGKYPGDIAYNAARIGKYLFHNLKYTDPVLLSECEKRGVEPVNVKQGYTKCSISIINEHSIITSDTGIAEVATSKGINVLQIPPHPSILLPGLDYGFIGGSTGLIDKYKWFITGDPESLSSKADIFTFLSERKMAVVFPDTFRVLDIGSILPLEIYQS